MAMDSGLIYNSTGMLLLFINLISFVMQHAKTSLFFVKLDSNVSMPLQSKATSISKMILYMYLTYAILLNPEKAGKS